MYVYTYLAFLSDKMENPVLVKTKHTLTAIVSCSENWSHVCLKDPARWSRQAFLLCSQVCFSPLDYSLKNSQVSDLAEKNVWKLGNRFL